MQASLAFRNWHLVISWLQEILEVNCNFREPVFLELQIAERKKTTAFSVQQLVFLT